MALHKGRVTDACGARWFPELERRLALFGITVRWTQLIGNYGPSGGTHGGGLCGDFIIVNTGGRSVSDAYFIAIREARQMGGSAAWHRPYNWDGRRGIAHGHLIGNGCSHITSQARAQLTGRQGVFNGRNGLANYGADPGSPKPPPKRTWAQGITWAAQQNTDTKDWFDMATEAQLRKIVREELDAAQKRKTVTVYEPTRTAEELKKNPKAAPATMLGRVNAAVDRLEAKLDAVLRGSGKA